AARRGSWASPWPSKPASTRRRASSRRWCATSGAGPAGRRRRERGAAHRHARQRARALAACGVTAELVVIRTRGDAEVDRPLHQLEGKGFFTKEIEDALLAGRID